MAGERRWSATGYGSRFRNGIRGRNLPVVWYIGRVSSSSLRPSHHGSTRRGGVRGCCRDRWLRLQLPAGTPSEWVVNTANRSGSGGRAGVDLHRVFGLGLGLLSSSCPSARRFAGIPVARFCREAATPSVESHQAASPTSLMLRPAGLQDDLTAHRAQAIVLPRLRIRHWMSSAERYRGAWTLVAYGLLRK